MPTRCDALTRTALGSEWMGGAPIDLNAEVYAWSFGFFFSSRRRHTRWNCDWSSDVCSSDLVDAAGHGDWQHPLARDLRAGELAHPFRRQRQWRAAARVEPVELLLLRVPHQRDRKSVV